MASIDKENTAILEIERRQYKEHILRILSIKPFIKVKGFYLACLKASIEVFLVNVFEEDVRSNPVSRIPKVLTVDKWLTPHAPIPLRWIIKTLTIYSRSKP